MATQARKKLQQELCEKLCSKKASCAFVAFVAFVASAPGDGGAPNEAKLSGPTGVVCDDLRGAQHGLQPQTTCMSCAYGASRDSFMKRFIQCDTRYVRICSNM